MSIPFNSRSLFLVLCVQCIILFGEVKNQGLIISYRYNRIEDVYLRFYNGRTSENYVEFPLAQASRLLEFKDFNKDSPVVLYIHGFNENAQQESVQVMVNAYRVAKPGTNIILLDWSNMSQGPYVLNAATNTLRVGLAAAEQLNRLLDAGLNINNLHLIGFSLGSHIAGYTARELKIRYYKIIKRLTALDPAFPAFYPGLVMKHVRADDAEFVDVIHTNPGGYGAPVPTGTADFWPNGVTKIQPGCPLFAPIPLSEDNLCSHFRAWRYYAESVLNPEAFPALPAISYPTYQRNAIPQTGMVYMGFNCTTRAQGSYYLTTNSYSPFGKGMAGL